MPFSVIATTRDGSCWTADFQTAEEAFDLFWAEVEPAEDWHDNPNDRAIRVELRANGQHHTSWEQ